MQMVELSGNFLEEQGTIQWWNSGSIEVKAKAPRISSSIGVLQSGPTYLSAVLICFYLDK